MRKDAKVGFAIGGVLLAVLTVYAIVVPKHNNAKPAGVTLVTPPASHGDAAAPAGNNELPPAVTSALNGDKAPAEPKPEAVATSDTPKSSDGVNWAKLLSGNTDAPTLMSTTPPPTDDAAKEPPVTKAAAPVSAEEATPVHDSPSSESLPLLAKTDKPATQPLSTGRTYTIKPGQTLSSVAAEVYGNQRFYVAILRANPTVNPARLKPGMKITLPDISDVQPTAAVTTPVAKETASEHAASASTGHTYKVESGDNLYRISRKLFGSPKLADTIYELNKGEIGPDKTRLKLGMVLQLPSAPSAGATASTR